MYQETKFVKAFIEKTDEILPRCYLIRAEKPLYKAQQLLERQVYSRMIYNSDYTYGNVDVIGRIDLIFKYKGCLYAVEVKFNDKFTNYEFWDALKIVGYTEYLNWQDEPIKKFKPAVMIPKNKIKLEHRIVAGKLDLTIFAIVVENGKYKVERLD